jgi:hypothetical protein
MKMKTFVFFLLLFTIISCGKYRDYNDLEVIENSFSGSMTLSESTYDIDGEFLGDTDSGVYTFIWDNPAKGMVLNVINSSEEGTIQFVIEDSRGNEVLNESLSSAASDAFSKDGKKGKWKVKVVFTDFKGEGKFDLNPIQ